jgi:membrane protease YdiL (CAAX protease family)
MNSLATLIAASLATFSVVSWAWLAARVQRGVEPVAYRPRRPVPWSGGDLCLVVLIFIMANLAAFSLLPMRDRGADLAIGGHRPADGSEAARAAENVAQLDGFELKMIAGATANVVTLLAAAAWLVARRRADWSDLGWGRERAWQDVWLGVVGFVAVSLPVYALQFALSRLSSQQHPIIETLGRQPNDWLFFLSGLSAVAVAPVAEEFFFRVLFQGWLESLADPARADRPIAVGPVAAGPDAADPPAETPDGSTEPFHVETTAAPAVASPAASAVFGDAFRAPAAEGARPRPPLKTGPNQPWDTAAIGITSLVFALLHLGQGWAPVPLFFLSLALGWLYQRTHRLLPSLVVHMCLNACSLLMLRMASG